MDIQELTEKLFTKNAGSAHSINIQMDTLPEGITNVSEYFAKFLTDLFVSGLKMLYGENGKVDLVKMTDSQFLNMKKYIQSIGFDVHLKIYPKVNKHRTLRTIGSNNSKDLDFWVLTVVPPSQDKCYSIWFTELEKTDKCR